MVHGSSRPGCESGGYPGCAGWVHIRLETMIDVTASELIHSTQLVAGIRSARPSVVPVSDDAQQYEA